jgi:hypothetical protein
VLNTNASFRRMINLSSKPQDVVLPDTTTSVSEMQNSNLFFQITSHGNSRISRLATWNINPPSGSVHELKNQLIVNLH